MIKKRILFFGSGDFPRETFTDLIERDWEYEIVGLVTSFDKCEDKGKTLRDIATENNIPFVTVKDCNDIVLEEWCKSLNPDMFIVISFKKISNNLLTIVDNRAFNVHASMLPLLRGSNPIRWAIRQKFTETGLTAIELSDKIDNGRILDNVCIPISEDDNYGTLKSKLAAKCSVFTVQVLKKYEVYTPVQQTNCGSKLSIFNAPKLSCSYFKIGIGEDVETVLRSILPYNGIKCTLSVSEKQSSSNFLIGYSYTPIEHIDCTIWALHKTKKGESSKIPIFDMMTFSAINYIIDEIQIEGKKRMPIDDFINGFKYLKPLKEDKGLRDKKYRVYIELR